MRFRDARIRPLASAREPWKRGGPSCATSRRNPGAMAHMPLATFVISIFYERRGSCPYGVAMRFLSSISFGWVLVALALGSANCGGLSKEDAGLGPNGSFASGASTGTSGAQSGCSKPVSGSGTASGFGGSSGGTPPVHRPVATACVPTFVASAPDAGTLNCTTDADCQGDAGTLLWCLQGTCRVDQCMTDGDCASGTACGCAGSLTGLPANACVASGCRVDEDCGACGLCSPTVALGGPFYGYQCRTATDSCTSDVDCMANQNDSNYVWCDYGGPATGGGHWSCMSRLVMH
jgi:hypothetical protein